MMHGIMNLKFSPFIFVSRRHAQRLRSTIIVLFPHARKYNLTQYIISVSNF